jgi:hypothetical protein
MHSSSGAAGAPLSMLMPTNPPDWELATPVRPDGFPGCCVGVLFVCRLGLELTRYPKSDAVPCTPWAQGRGRARTGSLLLIVRRDHHQEVV